MLSLHREAPFEELWLFSDWRATLPLPPELRLSASRLEGSLRFPLAFTRLEAFVHTPRHRRLPLGIGCVGFDLSLFGKLFVWLRFEDEVEEGVLDRVCLVTAFASPCFLTQDCEVLLRNAGGTWKEEKRTDELSCNSIFSIKGVVLQVTHMFVQWLVPESLPLHWSWQTGCQSSCNFPPASLVCSDACLSLWGRTCYWSPESPQATLLST